jgi:hypothetical protein
MFHHDGQHYTSVQYPDERYFVCLPLWRLPLAGQGLRVSSIRALEGFAMKSQFWLTTVASLALISFPVAYPHSAHADTVTIIGTNGTNGVPGPPSVADGGPGGKRNRDCGTEYRS